MFMILTVYQVLLKSVLTILKWSIVFLPPQYLILFKKASDKWQISVAHGSYELTPADKY